MEARFETGDARDRRFRSSEGTKAKPSHWLEIPEVLLTPDTGSTTIYGEDDADSPIDTPSIAVTFVCGPFEGGPTLPGRFTKGARRTAPIHGAPAVRGSDGETSWIVWETSDPCSTELSQFAVLGRGVSEDVLRRVALSVSRVDHFAKAAWLPGGFRALAAAPVSISALGSDASPAGGALLRWQKGGSQIVISATRHDDAVWAVLGFAIVKPGPKLVRGRPGLGGKLTIRPGVGSGWKVRAWREAGLDIVLQGDVSDRQLDRLLERMRIAEQGDWKPLIASAS